MPIAGAKQLCPVHHSCNIFALGVRDGPIWGQCSRHARAGVAMGFRHALPIAGQHDGIGGVDLETVQSLVVEMYIRRPAPF